MDAMRESWTDARMDDLNAKVDDLGRRMESGFSRVDADLRHLRQESRAEFVAFGEQANRRFEGLEDRLAAMHRTMVQFCGLALALIGLAAALVGLVAI